VLCNKARVIPHQAHGGALVVYYPQAAGAPFLPPGVSRGTPPGASSAALCSPPATTSSVLFQALLETLQTLD
jgi:hypothetical protein